MILDKNKLKSICVGELLYSTKHFTTIFHQELGKSLEQFANIPVKIIVKRLSNNKVIDILGIKRIEINSNKTSILMFCPTNEKNSIFTHQGSIYKLKLKTLSSGKINEGFEYLKKIVCSGDGMEEKTFYDLPVKVIVIDQKTEKILDYLDIATTLMNDNGSGIFYHCLIDDDRMIAENPGLEKVLDESEKKYASLIRKLMQTRND